MKYHVLSNYQLFDIDEVIVGDKKKFLKWVDKMDDDVNYGKVVLWVEK